MCAVTEPCKHTQHERAGTGRQNIIYSEQEAKISQEIQASPLRYSPKQPEESRRQAGGPIDLCRASHGHFARLRKNNTGSCCCRLTASMQHMPISLTRQAGTMASIMSVAIWNRDEQREVVICFSFYFYFFSSLGWFILGEHFSI